LIICPIRRLKRELISLSHGIDHFIMYNNY
jgi:hypothetical protein